jgi:hypothetical protein
MSEKFKSCELAAKVIFLSVLKEDYSVLLQNMKNMKSHAA